MRCCGALALGDNSRNFPKKKVDFLFLCFFSPPAAQGEWRKFIPWVFPTNLFLCAPEGSLGAGREFPTSCFFVFLGGWGRGVGYEEKRRGRKEGKNLQPFLSLFHPLSSATITMSSRNEPFNFFCSILFFLLSSDLAQTPHKPRAKRCEARSKGMGDPGNFACHHDAINFFDDGRKGLGNGIGNEGRRGKEGERIKSWFFFFF